MIGSIGNNKSHMMNYGERHRAGERISTVIQVVSKRFVKQQSRGWIPLGAHLLLQIRTRVLNDEPEDLFRKWYPACTKAAWPPDFTGTRRSNTAAPCAPVWECLDLSRETC